MRKTLLTLLFAGTATFLNAQNRMAITSGNNSTAAAIQQNLSGIKVTGGGCDSISNFLITYTPTIYTDQGGGYVAGQNSYGDIAKADKYGNPFGTGTVDGAIYLFGAAASSGTGQTFSPSVWDNDGTGGLPNTVLGSTTVLYDTIVANLVAFLPTTVAFSPAINVADSFYVGVSFGNAAGDTLALITSQDGEVPMNFAYEQFSSNDWHAYSETPTSWGISVAHSIFPVVCSPVGVHEVLTPSGNIAVAPNPSSTGVFTVVVPGHDMSKPVTMNVYDANGALVLSADQTAGKDFTYNLNLKNVAKGIYLLKVETSNGLKTQKITVN